VSPRTAPREDAKHQPDVELSKSREGTRREQQRIAGEKGRQHQSGFAENHEKEDRVDMRAIVRDQLADVFAQSGDVRECFRIPLVFKFVLCSQSIIPLQE
jgi:hypothetical protein